MGPLHLGNHPREPLQRLRHLQESFKPPVRLPKLTKAMIRATDDRRKENARSSKDLRTGLRVSDDMPAEERGSLV